MKSALLFQPAISSTPATPQQRLEGILNRVCIPKDHPDFEQISLKCIGTDASDFLVVDINATPTPKLELDVKEGHAGMSMRKDFFAMDVFGRLGLITGGDIAMSTWTPDRQHSDTSKRQLHISTQIFKIIDELEKRANELLQSQGQPAASSTASGPAV